MTILNYISKRFLFRNYSPKALQIMVIMNSIFFIITIMLKMFLKIPLQVNHFFQVI